MGQGQSKEELMEEIENKRKAYERIISEVKEQKSQAQQEAAKERTRASAAEKDAVRERARAEANDTKLAEERERVRAIKQEAASAIKHAEEVQREAAQRALECDKKFERLTEQARKAKQDADKAKENAYIAQQAAAQVELKSERNSAEEKQRASEAQQEAIKAKKLAQTADQEAAKAREQADKAAQEAIRQKETAQEALWEANNQSERLITLQNEIEEQIREEQRQREEFRWGPKKNHHWTEEEYQELVTKFKQTDNVENKPPNGLTFLLFGPTSHGKSSFGNGCLAALENLDNPPMRHHVAQGGGSVSRKFSIQEYGPHRIIDMPGIFESETITSDSIKMIVTGQISWGSKITPHLEVVDPKTAYDNTVECIIIIMKYDCDLPPQLKRQIGAIMDVCGEEVVSCHLVLTHLDICDPQFKDPANLPNIYKSTKVLKAVQNMWEQTGIPANNISFVKNYATETETDLNSKLQYLRILNVAKDTANLVVTARENKAKEELYQMKKQFKWGPKKQPKWSKQECQRLTDKFVGKVKEEQVSEDQLKTQKPNTEKGLTFLLFGPTGHGKSSFGNGCWAALKNTETTPTYHEVRQSEGSVSSQFSVQKHGPHKIIDMPGIFEAGDIKSVDIRKIVTGQVPWDSKITTTLETKDEKQSSGDTVECVIIILKYDCDLPRELKRQIQVILDLSGEGELSYHLVITHMDACDPQFKDTDNLPNIYKSVKVLREVERMSRETGIPPSKISFVKNYTDEIETDLNSKLQCLRILDLAKEHAMTLLEKKSTKADVTKENMNKTKLFAEGIFSIQEFVFFLGVMILAVLIVYLST